MAKKNRKNRNAAQSVAEAPKPTPEVVTEVVAEPEPPAPEVAVEPVVTEPTPEVVAEPAATEPPAAQPDAEHSAELAEAEAAVASAKAALEAARLKLASLTHGPVGAATDGDGNPLSAGKKAWLTRLARGFVPREKPAKAPIDPNTPNLTAGQKAALTRKARLADPNYKPPQNTAKVDPTVRLNAAIANAFGEVGTRVDMTGSVAA